MDTCVFSPAKAEAEHRAAEHGKRKPPLSYGNRPGTNRTEQPTRPPGDHYTESAYRRAIERACDKAFPPPEHLAQQQVPGKKGMRWEKCDEWRTRLKDEGWEELKRWRAKHRWTLNQLRHSAAPHLRHEFGLDVAQTVLGHQIGSTITEYTPRRTSRRRRRRSSRRVKKNDKHLASDSLQEPSQITREGDVSRWPSGTGGLFS